MKYCLLVSLFTLSALSSFAFGYDPVYKWMAFTGGYSFMNDKADMRANLGGGMVNAMTIDNDGHIWMAASGSVLRMYDGSKLTDVKIPKESFAHDANILCLAADSKNTIWIGTSEGLVKYDGSTWSNIDRSNTNLQAITGIAVTGTDKIYITGQVPYGPKMEWMKGGGLSFYNGQSWTTFTAANSTLPDDSLENLVVDNGNHLWAIPGRGDAGVAKFDGKNWKIFNTGNTTMPTNMVRAIATNASGKVWVATTKGIVCNDGADWKLQAFTNGFNSKKLAQYASGGSIDVTSLAVENNGTIWMGTQNEGVFCIRPNTFRAFNRENSLLSVNSVFKIIIDKENRKWFATGNRNSGWGAYYVNSRNHEAPFMVNGDGVVALKESDKIYDPKWTIIDNTNTDLALGSTMSIGEDKEGNIWMPNDADGLIKYKDGVRTIYRNGGEFGSAFNKMFIAPDGKIYLNTNVSGVKVFENGAFKDYAKWPNMGGVTDMAYDKDGVLWASGTGGLSKRTGEDWETYNKKNGDLPSIIIYTVFKDSKGMLWAGTAKGLVKYDGTTWTVLRKSDVEFPSDDITAIAEDKDGKIWFGTKAGISIYDGANWTHISQIESPKVKRPTINAISFDKAGVAWIGTNEDGLLRYDGKTWTQYNRKDGGTIFDKVTAVKVASDGKVYVATEFYELSSSDFTLPNAAPGQVLEGNMRKKIKTSDPRRIVAIIEP